ncbi:zinc finger protein BALDIBIS [Cornus florida]|uniref:zinc finger protein BALDIBIS n=1 Tax=Cornus florida TaxID=4283 RepID=UPI00289E7173|nr:zinc finger protein BALDIBIS [Cornus florida]
MMSGDMFSIPSSIKGFPHHEPDPPNPNPKPTTNSALKKKRNQPGTPDPDAEVIALSPKTLMATNRFICEICNKGFQRDQNLQLHRRGHNLPWKLKQRTNKEVKKKVYICPEKTCVHHDPSRALGDLTGIKKHFSRKHGEKKWKCEKCSKKYAVQSDWKAHSKTCGTREYKCDCGTLFSRKDSFITHRAFCDALAEESARFSSVAATNLNFKNDVMNETMINPQSDLSHGLTCHSGISQFGTNFRPDFGVMACGNTLSGEQQKPILSLWLNQSNSQLNPIEMAPNSNPYVSSGSTSTGFPDHMVQMESSNVFGSSSMANFANISNQLFNKNFPLSTTSPNLSLSPLLQARKDEAGLLNKGNMVETLSPLYSGNQNIHNHQSDSTSSMSATALLQKAAQIGSTRSSPSPFLGNMSTLHEVMNSSSSSNASSFNARNRSELNHIFHRQPENVPTTRAGGLVPFSDSIMGSSNLSSLTSTTSSNLDHHHHQIMMQTSLTQTESVVPGKLHPGGSNIGAKHGLTRDFLGMGGEELAKFASMNSAMGLSHFTSNQTPL